MNQFTIGLLVALGLVTFYLYNQNETLKENNTKLEYALEEQTQAMTALRESYEKQGQSLMNMTRRNAEIEQVNFEGARFCNTVMPDEQRIFKDC